jgi:hypothetical protein
LKGAEHRDGRDRRFCERRRDVCGDAGEPHHFDLKTLSGRHGSLEIRTAEMLKTERQGAAGDRLLENIRVLNQLIADGRSDEVGPIRVEALLDQEIDLAEVDHAHVDGHLLGLAGARLPRLWGDGWDSCHLLGFHLDSN